MWVCCAVYNPLEKSYPRQERPEQHYRGFRDKSHFSHFSGSIFLSCFVFGFLSFLLLVLTNWPYIISISLLSSTTRSTREYAIKLYNSSLVLYRSRAYELLTKPRRTSFWGHCILVLKDRLVRKIMYFSYYTLGMAYMTSMMIILLLKIYSVTMKIGIISTSKSDTCIKHFLN